MRKGLQITIHLTVWLILLCNITLFGQTTSFIYYDMEKGLVQNQVQSITQDDDGNLWIGTIAGLSRFDGTRWKSYTKNHGLAEDWITCSYKDQKGNLWFGHWAGGITRLNKESGNFENLKLEEYTRFKSIRQILEDKTGNYWIATEGAGVFVFDPVAEKMFSLSRKDGLSSGTIYAMTLDGEKNIWLASDSGITIFQSDKSIGNTGAFTRIAKPDGLFSNNIISIYYTSTGLMLLGSADHGLGIIPLDKNIKDFRSHCVSKQIVLGAMAGLKSTFIRSLYEDHNKNIWAGTLGGGVSLLLTEKNQLTPGALANGIFKTYSTRQGLSYFNVETIFEDREYNLWFGTDLGLNQFRGERIQIFDEADQIPNNIVWSVACDRNGNVWLGTNNGLAKMSFSYSFDGKIETNHIKVYTEKDGLSSNAILSCYEDSKGNMWFGTAFNGVCMLPKGAEKFLKYGISDGIPNEVVYSIAEDKNGFMWFGTKGGATRFDPNTGSSRNFTVADGLSGNHVYRIFRDSKGLLWIGALGGSLCVYDGNSFKKFDETNGLNHKFVLCINEDRNGNIWFGCYGGGLFRYDGKTFKNYNTESGLNTESPFSIIVDKANNIWIGDNHGIDKFDVKQNRFYHFGKQEGFLGVECNPNAAAMDPNGNLWFGTIMGVARFNPALDIPNEMPPLTKIAGIKIHLRDTVFPSDAQFAYDENNLTFKFIGVSLTNPEKIRYEYTLEGFDAGWIPCKGINEATYTNLPAGDYVFKVRAFNNDDVPSEPAIYKFSVKPPFWQTALFYVCMVAFLVFGIFVFDRVRTRNLKIAKAQLEKKVEERTIQLAIKNEELAEKNKDITDSIRYAKRIQEAMLVKEQDLAGILPEHFILFKPKDIVSGDFYWAQKRNNDVYVAAVDCTGHGVPGAFLSLISQHLLNDALDITPDGQPSKVLDNLSSLAEHALHSTIDGVQLRDGLDIGLCRIKSGQTTVVQFAGAYNSLYLVRENKLIEYPADHISIGNQDEKKPYSHHEFVASKGDVIYLFSDGYADQFGGEKGKKYKYNQLQDFLLKHHAKSMDLQKHLLEEEFNRWKGDLEQVDDVLVLGIRL